MSKVKQPTKLKNKTKPIIQKPAPIREQLPYYLNDTSPLFAEDKCAEEGYFNDRQALRDEDTVKCQQLLTSYIQSEKETQQRIQELREFTCESGANLDSSLPFYTCKSIIFNEYLICLKMYELFRLNAADFTQGPGLRLYQRLVYLKTLILKLTPVENKLEYQKNKLLKKGDKIRIKQFKKRETDGNQQEQDQENHNDEEQQQQQQASANQNEEPLQEENEQDNLGYKPAVKNLILNQSKNQKEKQGKYVAPRQSAILPTEQKAKRRQQRRQQRRKVHLLRKFKGDIESGDEAQQKHLLQGIDERFKRRYEQKLRFEQQNFTRLNETKKQKYWKKQMMKNRFNNSLNNELKEIEMIRELVQDETEKNNRPAPIPSKMKTSQPKSHKRRKMQ